jgi:zinc protease
MRLRRAVTLAVVLIAAGCAVNRYKVKGRPVEYEGFYAIYRSGMRTVIYQMPHVDRFTVAVSYRAGSADDPPGKEGLAHLAEHLAFRIRPGGPAAPRLWDRLIGSGWTWNAATSSDDTVYWEVGNAEGLRAALELEAARMRDALATVSQEEFSLERDVVVAEYRQRFETHPEAAELDWVRQAAFAGHPYGRPRAGTPESLARIALGEAKAWAKQRYGPEGALLAVISPREPREVAREIAAVFGDLADDTQAPAASIAYQPPPLPTAPDLPQEVKVHKAPVDHPVLWVAWLVPGAFDQIAPRTHAAAEAVESAAWARLGGWHESGVVHDVESGIELMDGAGLLWTRVLLDKAEDAERVAGAVRFAAGELVVQVQRWKARLITRLREQLLMDAYLGMEQMDARAILRFVRATNTPDYLRGWSSQVAAQLQFDVDRYADDFLTSKRSVAVLVQPDAQAGWPAASPSAAGRGEADRDPLEEDLAGLPPPTLERTRAAARSPGLDRAERRTLPNGLEVVLARRGTLPVAAVRLVFRTDGDGTEGSAPALRFVAVGAGRSSFASSRQARVAARVSRSAGPEHLVLGVRGSSANLDALLDSVSEWAREFQTSYLDLTLKDYNNRLRREVRTPSSRARGALLGGLFPGHAYGWVPTPAELERQSFGDVRRWIDRQMRPERATLLVTSDVAPTPELWAFLEDEFGGWKRGEGPRPVPAAEPPLPDGPRVLLVDRPGASQAALLVGFRTPPRASRDAPAQRAVEWLLRSRLEQRLRVEQGISYGVQLHSEEHARGAALVVSTAVERPAAARSLGQILAGARGLGQSPVSPRTAGWAAWQVARAHGVRFDTVRGAARALEEMTLDGRPADYFETLRESIASLDAQRIQAAARGLATGREVAVVVGDRAALEPQLKAAGYRVEVVPEPVEAR